MLKEIRCIPSAMLTNILVFEKMEKLLGKDYKFLAGANQFFSEFLKNLQQIIFL